MNQCDILLLKRKYSIESLKEVNFDISSKSQFYFKFYSICISKQSTTSSTSIASERDDFEFKPRVLLSVSVLSLMNEEVPSQEACNC